MGQFLYRLQPTRPAMLAEGPTEREASVVAEHFAYLTRLRDEGTVLMAGRTLTEDEHAFGIVVLEAADEEAARGLMNDDPAVREGVMTAEVYPYRIALWSNGPEP